MQTAIRQAFEAKAAAAAGWPAAWAEPNKAFTPVRGTPWARTAMLFGNEENIGIPASQGTVEALGVFSIEYFGLVDVGAGAAEAFVDGQRAAFPVGSFVAIAGGLYARIDSFRPEVADREERNWYHQPLSIGWTLTYLNPTL